MDYRTEDLLTPIMLHPDLTELYRQNGHYSGRAHETLNTVIVTLHRLISRPTRPHLSELQRWVACREWTWDMGSGFRELRTALVYAAAHFRRLEPRRYHKSQDPTSLAFQYFAEDFAVRALSLAEKTAQFLNVFCCLGLSEVREVSLHRVRQRLQDPKQAAIVDRLVDAVRPIESYRNAQVHRFDPGAARTEVTQVTSEGHERQLWSLREGFLPASEAFELCERTYGRLDQSLAELMCQVNADLSQM